MTLCPIAIVSGCAKCPAFKICPLKGVIGDQPAAGANAPPPPAAKAAGKGAGKGGGKSGDKGAKAR